MKHLKILFLLFFIFAFIQLAFAQKPLEQKVQEYTLKNGLKILIVERHQVPIVSAYILYKVGSVDEISGKTGIAHMVEHMMFNGTETVGTKDYAKEKPLADKVNKLCEELDMERLKGNKADTTKIKQLRTELQSTYSELMPLVVHDEFRQIYERNGGVDFNAMTTNDYTLYTISLPSNKIELWASAESERIKNTVFRNYYLERDAVIEERRMRFDTNPMGKLYSGFMATAFVAHNYKNSVIGWETDIEFMKKDDCEKFFRSYYSPNNMVMILVGDVYPKETVAMIEKYFGNIPSQQLPDPIRTVEPEQMGERRAEIVFDAEPQMIIGYHKPTAPDYDDYVFDVINNILSSGRTSRLYKKLVEEEQLVADFGVWSGPGSRYPNMFIFYLVPMSPHTTEEVESALYKEIDRLKTEPITEKELQKVINQMEADFIRGMDSNDEMASTLAHFESGGGGWRYLTTYMDVLKKITPQDVMRVANKYLTKENRTVVILVKKSN